MVEIDLYGYGKIFAVLIKKVKILDEDTFYYRSNKLGIVFRTRFIQRTEFIQPETHFLYLPAHIAWNSKKVKGIVNKDIKLLREGLENAYTKNC